MSCKDDGECGSCEGCPEKVEEAKMALEMWKSIFKKAIAGGALSTEEEVLVRMQLKDFENA